MTFDHLDKLKQQLDSHRPLPQAVVSNLHESLVLQWTYHSNAIEGNTLTLKETNEFRADEIRLPSSGANRGTAIGILRSIR